MNTAESLIGATRELPWERGYTGTSPSPSAIQRRAGAGRGSMYPTSPGNPDLAAAAVRRSAGQLRVTAAEADFTGAGGARERVRAYLLRERSVLRGCRLGGLARTRTSSPTSGCGPRWEETFGWLRGRLAQVLEEGRARGEFAATLDPSGTAAAVVAVVQGGMCSPVRRTTPSRYGQAVGGLLALLDTHTRGER